MNIWGCSPLRLTGLISSLSKGLTRVLSSTMVWKHQFFSTLLLCGPAPTTVHDYCKDHSFDYITLLAKCCLCFLIGCLGLSLISCREAIVFWFQGCNHHPQWFLRAQEEEICHYFHLFPLYLLWNDEAGCHDLSCCCCFLIFSFNRAFSLTSFTLIRSFFGFLLLSAIRVVSYTCLGLLITSHRIISIYTPGQCLLHLPSLIP